MFQVEGSIYLFALIHPKHQNMLMELQSSLAEHVQNPGYMPFLKYRAFKTLVREADEPFRFVDGDLIERFLDCDAELQEKIVEKVGMGAEEVRSMVEGLRRLH
jgi:DNA damage-binding protein 1